MNNEESLSKFRKYLNETPKEIIQADIDRIKAMNFPGPTIEEYFNNFETVFNMKTVEAPFTEEQVDNINDYQTSYTFHPFTCCSPEDIEECLRAKGEDDGILIASKEGLTCPCGKYKQDWVHEFMALKRNNLKLENNESSN